MAGQPRRFLPELYPFVVGAVVEDDLAREKYGWSEDTRSRLYALSLTCKAMRIHAQPALFQTIHLYGVEEIRRLLESSKFGDEGRRSPFAHTRRILISIPDTECSSPPNCLLQLLTSLSEHAKLIEAFAFDIPFRRCESKVWKAFNAELRAVFRQLPLRELISLRDEVFFSLPWGAASPRRAEWQYFQGLERLVIYNPVLDEDLLLALLSMPRLHTAVLMRADEGWSDNEALHGGATVEALHKACERKADGSRRELHVYVSGGWAGQILRSGMMVRKLAELQAASESGFGLHMSIREDGVPEKIEHQSVSFYMYRDWARELVKTGSIWRDKRAMTSS